MKKKSDNLDDICWVGINTAGTVIRTIHKHMQASPKIALGKALASTGKSALNIDNYAEMLCRLEIHQHFPDAEVYGEESLNGEECKSIDLSKINKLSVLADAVDGTDLLERELGNWCSCFLFFDGRRKVGERLLASFVALPNKDIYYARADKKGAYVCRSTSDAQKEVQGPSKVAKLSNASICFYGQKIKNLKETITQEVLRGIEVVQHQEKEPFETSNFRVYNLAGIPMMMKLIDHRVKNASSIDLVFDLCGQKPHDVVPGAFIALKAGAVLKNLNGVDIKVSDLEEVVMKPSSAKLKYILASTPQLGEEFLKVLTVSKGEKEGGGK